jgi:hypothetical protein
MIACPDELHTRHHRGRWYDGFGPVHNDERVLFAVFADTPRDNDILDPRAFGRNMNKTTQSLARCSYVSRPVFDRTVVGTRALHGVAIAHVQAIRALTAPIQIQHETRQVRAVCVVDLVERGDCTGHAAMGFSEQVEGAGLSPGQLGKVRERIRLELAHTFSRIAPADSVVWPSDILVLAKRLLFIVRSIRALVTRLWGRAAEIIRQQPK